MSRLFTSESVTEGHPDKVADSVSDAVLDALLAQDVHSRVAVETLVTTGTGSGKTEAFLYPILDHCLRARRQGVAGMKAPIPYPMNALANDQAQRLARLITRCPHPRGVAGAGSSVRPPGASSRRSGRRRWCRGSPGRCGRPRW